MTWVSGMLNMSQKCALEAEKDNCLLVCTKHSPASWSREVTVLLCASLLWHHLEYCMQFWVPHCKNNTKLLECVERMTKMVRGLKGKT